MEIFLLFKKNQTQKNLLFSPKKTVFKLVLVLPNHLLYIYKASIHIVVFCGLFFLFAYSCCNTYIYSTTCFLLPYNKYIIKAIPRQYMENPYFILIRD